MDGIKEVLFDIDDDLLTEFAEEEKEETNSDIDVENSDSEDNLEFGNLADEFAANLSDSEDDNNKSVEKILLSSDDEIDNLLDDFNDEGSTESKSDPVKNEANLDLTRKVVSGNICIKQEPEEINLCVENEVSHSGSAPNFSKENNSFRDVANKVVQYENSSDILNRNDNLRSRIPAEKENTKSLDSLVKSFIELKHEKPSSASHTQCVTILCDENVLNSESCANKISMSQIIGHAIDECIKSKSIASKVLSTDKVNGTYDVNIESQESGSTISPEIQNVTGSAYDVEENHIANDNSTQRENSKSIVKDEVSEGAKRTKNCSFPVSNLSVKSEEKIKPNDSDNALKYLKVNSTDSIKRDCISPENNKCNSLKSLMTENSMYKQHSNIPKIALEIKIHISSENNSISSDLNEPRNFTLSHSDKTESFNSKTAGISINLNGLADKFLVPITTDQTGKSHTKNDLQRELTSNAVQLTNTQKAPENSKVANKTLELKKRKLETCDSVISMKTKRQKVPIYIAQEVDFRTTSVINNKVISKVQFSEKVLDYLALLAFKKMVSTHFQREYNEAEDIVKFLKEKLENLTKHTETLSLSFKKLLQTQKENASYKKVKTRTVGINVKILDAENKAVVKVKKSDTKEENKDKEVVKIQDVKLSDEYKNTKEEKKVKEIVKIQEKKSPGKNKNIEEKKVKEIVKIQEKKSPDKNKNREEKKVKQIVKIQEKKSPDKNKNIKEEKKISPNDSKKVFQKPKTVPTDVVRPSVIKRTNRLIPDLTPTKSTSTVNNSDSLLKNLLNSSKPQVQLEKNKKDTSKVENNTEKKTLPHQPAENGLVSFKKFLQMLPSAKGEMPKSSCSQIVPSSVASTTSASPVTQVAAPSYSSHVKKFPFVSSSHRNEMMQPPRPSPPGSRSSPNFHNMMFTKSAAGLIPNNNQDLLSQRFVQPYMQKGSMVSTDSSSFPSHHPTTAASNNYMQQSNLPPLSMHHLPNSSYNPLATMNYLSSSLGYPPPPPYPSRPPPMPYSVASGNYPPSSGMPYPAFYPRSSMKHPMPYSPYPINNFISPPHDFNQLQLMAAKNAFANVTANSSAQSSSNLNSTSSSNIASFTKPPSAIPPPSASFAKPMSATAPPSASFKKPMSATPPPSASFTKPVSATPPPSASFTKPVSATPPPSASFTKPMSATPSPPASSPKVIPTTASSQKIPPVPDGLSYNEPIPKPTLNIVKQENDVVLSWNVEWKATSSSLSSFHIYSCHVSSEIEILPVWKKVGDIAAMRLPMACRLRQFEKNNSYHFIIRAVDNFQRIGPFSNPASVSF